MLKSTDLGFIETPYRKVENGKVDFSAEPIYLMQKKKKVK
jgi:DNA-directed RNA polymerase subunit beta